MCFTPLAPSMWAANSTSFLCCPKSWCSTGAGVSPSRGLPLELTSENKHLGLGPQPFPWVLVYSRHSQPEFPKGNVTITKMVQAAARGRVSSSPYLLLTVHTSTCACFLWTRRKNVNPSCINHLYADSFMSNCHIVVGRLTTLFSMSSPLSRCPFL